MVCKKQILILLLLQLLILFSVQKCLSQVTNSEAGLLFTVAGNGTAAAGYSGDGFAASASLLNHPAAVALDNAGNVYLSDMLNNRIRKITKSTGIITTIAGTGTAGFSGDDGAALSAQLNHPSDISMDLSGVNLYFFDSLNFRIRKINLSTGMISTIAGNGSGGYVGQTMPAINAGLNSVSGLVVLYQSYIFISLGATSRICEIDLTTGNIFTYAGTGAAGFSGDKGLAINAAFNNPAGLGVDVNGVLYVADSYNHRIRKIDTTGIVTTVAGTGIAGYTGDTAAAISASLNFPQSVCLDNKGSLFIADKNNHCIRQVDKRTGNIYTVAGSGVAGYSGDNSFAHTTCARLSNPTSVKVNAAGDFYIADNSNNCVRVVYKTLRVYIGSEFSPTDTAIICGNNYSVGYGWGYFTAYNPLVVLYDYQYKVNGMVVPRYNMTLLTALNDGDVVTAQVLFNTNCGIVKVVSNPIVIKNLPNVTPGITLTASANNICSASSAVTFTATLVNEGTNPVCNCILTGTGRPVNLTTSSHNPSFTANVTNGEKVYCILTSSEKCKPRASDTSNVITLTVYPTTAPAISIAASANNICVGQLVTFKATATNGGITPLYQWKINGVNVGTAMPAFTTSALQNGDTVSCILYADTNLPCVTNAAVNSNKLVINVVSGTGNASITITPSANNVCAGTPVTFTAATQNAGNSLIYQWKVNGINAGANNSIYSTDKLANGDQVSCSIAPNSSACFITATSNAVMMIIRDVPAIILTADSTIITPGGTVKLTAHVTSTIASYNWSPASLLMNATTTLMPVTKPISSNTSFALRVTNIEGCTTVAAINIQVPGPLLMPSAFTPNNDGVNDLFRIPPGILISLNDFSIYNRWGKKIFTTKDAVKGWDGKLNGTALQNDVFTYYIKGTYQGKAIMLKGTFVLIR